MILAGDIGGTKTHLAVFDPGDLRTPVRTATYRSQEYASFDAFLTAFVADAGHPVRAACFGAAGPVRDGRCTTTNLPWIVDAVRLRHDLGGARVWVINDLEATAYGVASLLADDFLVLNEGAPNPVGNAAIIAAGTGLGEAGLYWDGHQHWPFATEGGHTSFAPLDARGRELLAWLGREFGHVSWERVLSGPGLFNLYRFLRDCEGGAEPAWLTEALAAGDPASVVSAAARDGRSRVCAEALRLFAHLYGAEAGNMALALMATGGVYVGGGIAPKNVEALADGTFMRAFLDKGRMRALLETVPVRVILNDRTALLGAARCAALRAARA